MFLADNGSSWYLSGAPDPRWDDNELRQLGRLAGSDFEAVDESALMADPDSGRASGTALSRVASEVQVLEFRHDGGDYFLTVDPNEIAALDAGEIPGWTGRARLFSPTGLTAQCSRTWHPSVAFSAAPTPDSIAFLQRLRRRVRRRRCLAVE